MRTILVDFSIEDRRSVVFNGLEFEGAPITEEYAKLMKDLPELGLKEVDLISQMAESKEDTRVFATYHRALIECLENHMENGIGNSFARALMTTFIGGCFCNFDQQACCLSRYGFKLDRIRLDKTNDFSIETQSHLSLSTHLSSCSSKGEANKQCADFVIARHRKTLGSLERIPIAIGDISSNGSINDGAAQVLSYALAVQKELQIQENINLIVISPREWAIGTLLPVNQDKITFQKYYCCVDIENSFILWKIDYLRFLSVIERTIKPGACGNVHYFNSNK